MKNILRFSILALLVSFEYNCDLSLPNINNIGDSGIKPDVGPGILTFTNGNAKAELTGIPVINPNLVSTASVNTVSITVPVDADTYEIGVTLQNLFGTEYVANSVILTPGVEQSGTVIITIPANTFTNGGYVYPYVYLSISSAASTVWNFNTYGVWSTTYREGPMSGPQSSKIETGVIAPTLTITP